METSGISFSPSGGQIVPVLFLSLFCTLHRHLNFTRNGSSTKNPHFILLKDAFLGRYDAASMSTNKNPTEKCCWVGFFSASPEGSPRSCFASHNYSHCSPLSSHTAGHARGQPNPTQHLPPQTITTTKVNLGQPDGPTPPLQ